LGLRRRAHDVSDLRRRLEIEAKYAVQEEARPFEGREPFEQQLG
jgi:hypothetical protein